MQGHYTPNQKWTNEVIIYLKKFINFLLIKQIWGLDMFKDAENADKFATCSDDGTIRIWSLTERK